MGSVEEVRPTGTPISSSTLLATRHTYEGYTDIPGNGLHYRCWRQTIPGNPPTKRVYIRISLRSQFLYLAVSMRLTILAVTCLGSSELNALPSDCCCISSLRLTMCWQFLSDVCKHCANAGCLEACPTGSIVRTEVGSVFVQPVCATVADIVLCPVRSA
jgi:hypothetical protein